MRECLVGGTRCGPGLADRGLAAGEHLHRHEGAGGDRQHHEGQPAGDGRPAMLGAPASGAGREAHGGLGGMGFGLHVEFVPLYWGGVSRKEPKEPRCRLSSSFWMNLRLEAAHQRFGVGSNHARGTARPNRGNKPRRNQDDSTDSPPLAPGWKGWPTTSSGGAQHDVVVIGGGQAGLALGYYLAQRDSDFLILEREQDVGPAWRDRWDSLTLFTPRRYDSLPGLEFPGDPDGYPTRAEVFAYLQAYAAHFDLPVRLGTAALSLTHDGDQFGIELEDGRLTANQVVIATGPFQAPRIPAFAADLATDVVQVHSVGYRQPTDLPPG